MASKPAEPVNEELEDIAEILGISAKEWQQEPSTSQAFEDDVVEVLDDANSQSSDSSSFRIEPSGRLGHEGSFDPSATSSPLRTHGSDSEDDTDPRNQSLGSIAALVAREADLETQRRQKRSPDMPCAPPSTASTPVDLLARVVGEALGPLASGTQNFSLPTSQAKVSEVSTAIPAGLENLVSLESSSSIFIEDKVDWRVAEEPMIRASEDINGKYWLLRGGPDGQILRCSKDLFSEKLVSGKTLIALKSAGQQWTPLAAAFGKLKQPSEPGLMEPEQRRLRKSIISSFLAQESSFAKALGEWELGEDGKSVVVGKLPLLMQEVLDQKRQARPSSPPHSFEFSGKAGSEVEEIFKAVYTPDKDLKAFLDWGDYLTRDRLPEPSSSAALENIRKDLAQLARPLQCSLAAADIALHLGQLSSQSSSDQVDLRALIQVMGVLSTESALALLPRFDRQSQLYATEKRSVREKVLKGIKPPSTAIALQTSPVFSAGLFPEKVFREVDVKAREVDSQSFFPQFQAKPRPSPAQGTQQQGTSFKRPLMPQSQGDNVLRKKTKPSLPSPQARNPYSWRQEQPSTSKGFFPGGSKQGQQSNPSGVGRGKLPAKKAAPHGQSPSSTGGKAAQGGKSFQPPKSSSNNNSKGQSKRK